MNPPKSINFHTTENSLKCYPLYLRFLTCTRSLSHLKHTQKPNKSIRLEQIKTFYTKYKFVGKQLQNTTSAKIRRGNENAFEQQSPFHFGSSYFIQYKYRAWALSNLLMAVCRQTRAGQIIFQIFDALLVLL